MTLVELSFIAIAFIGVFGVIGIAAVDWKNPKSCNKKIKLEKEFRQKSFKS